jgi:aminopeptidase N
LLDTCGTDRLCNQANGVCDSLAPGLDCNKVASICWEKQVCDKSGYCAEAAVDTELDYDVELYDLTIDVDTKLDMFSATEKVFFKASKAGTKSIDLDIGVPASGWTPYMVSSVKDHAGKDVAFTQDDANGKLKLPLSATLAVGDSEVLTIQYTGAVNPITDENDPLFLSGLMHRPGADGQTSVVQTYGWPNNARRWIPSHDHPSDASRAIITVGLNDATMEPLANGVPVQDSMANGFHRRTFLLRQPVPAYALFVGAAAFHHEQMGVVDGVAIDTYMYEQDKSVPLNYWTGLLGEMHYLSQRFGQYPFERFAVLEIPDPLGGMEHATVVDVADWWIESDASSSQDGSIHEMIHHWWGDNARQRSWGEFWLNESMASYFTIDVYGAQTGPTAYQASMDLQKFYLFRSPVYYSDDTLHYQSATDDVPGQTTYASLNAPYVKGPWVWHMLRDSLGEDMFWKVVKAFYDASRFQKYDTALLLKTINQVSGKDYTQFFNEWVEQRGWPVMTSSFSYDAQKKEVTVTANQVQDAAWGTYTFTGPTALEFDLDDADPNTPTCQVMVSFTNGALTATAKSACAYTPTEMSMPFTSRFLIQPQ